ncbi:HlyD family type I secretion periplasmic adaptor subunit [Erwinia sp. HDF1-3R]|uniref:HlyD family type I secretion periplasmic adaptor subunit n=1 Tax=Erwinia sp. HDF1-3R TaxID=3141543 RepID=UPI0031F57638
MRVKYLISSYFVKLILPFLLLLALFLLKVDITVHAQGFLQIKNKNIQIDHPGGGRIESLYITEGQKVKKGELLAVVDNSYISESYDKSRVLLETLKLRKARITSEIEGKPFPISESYDPKLYAQEYSSYLTNLKEIEESVNLNIAIEKQKKAELNAKKIRIQGLEKQLEIEGRQIKMVSSLVKIKAAAEANLLEKISLNQRTKNDYNLEKSELKVVESEVEKAIINTKKIKSEFLSVKQKELENINDKLSDAKSDFSGANVRKTQEKIFSPVSGIIQKLVKNHKGSVIPQGGEIMEIAPTDIPLVAVVRLDPKDRINIWSGMQSKIEVGGFNNHRGSFNGIVNMISEDSFSSDNSQRYYQVEISLEDKKGKSLYPGMAIDAYIKTGKRSVAEYILWPVIKQEKYVFSE